MASIDGRVEWRLKKYAERIQSERSTQQLFEDKVRMEGEIQSPETDLFKKTNTAYLLSVVLAEIERRRGEWNTEYVDALRTLQSAPGLSENLQQWLARELGETTES